MIDKHAIDALLEQIEPWLALLDAQSLEQTGGDLELRQAFFGELRNATQDFAQAAQKSSLRGLCNVAMLLLRGMDTRMNKPLDDEDIGQLTLWLSGVQSYLDATLADASPLVTDLLALSWVPKLAPAAISTLQDRLREATTALTQCAQESSAAELAEQVQEPNVQVHVATQGNGVNESAAIESSTFEAFRINDSHTELNSTEHLGAAPTEPVADLASANFGQSVESVSPLEESISDATESQIWIANEEFQLVTETVQSRLLPCLSELAQASEPDKLAEHYGEAQYQIELLSNAFEVLGLEQSRKMCHVLLQSLAAPGADSEAVISERAPSMMHWIVMLVDFCDRPDNIEARESWVDFVGTEDWFAQLTPAHSAALKNEIASISVGLDPRLMAARKTEITEEETELKPAADVMPNVLQGMLIELPENARALSLSIENFVLSGELDSLDSARRVAHTLKGDANTVGIKGIANLTHSLEDIFIELAKQPAIPSRAFANLLMQASDCVSSMADHVLGRGEAPSDARSVMQEVLTVANCLIDGTPISELEFADSVAEYSAGETLPSQSLSGVTSQTARPEESALQTAERLAQFSLATAPAARAATVALADVPMLQIPADVLDRLLDFSSEALVLLRQIETQIKSVDEGQAEIERQRQDGAALLVELDNAVNLRGVAMQSSRKQGEEIDPLEMDQYNELYTVTRRLMEVSADEQSSRNVIERAARSLIELAAEQEKVQLELQDQIMRTRQVSVKDFVGRFQRAVRQTSKMLDKDVDFVVTGQDTMIDRVQMENLVDPLMHALRNSVDHGVEQQSMRLTRGKPISGQVNLSFARDGRSVSVKLSDDGAGLNYERIRAKAIQRGFMSETDQVSNDDLAQIILLPGFSTKEEVSQVSGRGIGLDVVYQRIQDLRGSLAIRSKQGSGMTMDIRLPASMTSLYCGLTQLDGGWAAIASDSVESFQLIEPYFCEVDGEQVYVTIEGERMPLLDLEAMIGGVRSRIKVPEQPGVGVLVRGVSGEAQLGFLPEIKEMRTVIVKDFGPYLRTFPGVRGGTILGDGTVAPVIDARELMRNTAYQPWSARDESYRAALAKTVKLRALIADDSLSVRRALEQLLTDAGFEVFAARDGLEALALIKESNPDILLLDLEMPRMNGLEVAAFVRKDSEFSEVPIIMITSRTSEKHVQMAKAAGVNDILSKPYAEDALLDLIQTHLGIVVKKAA